ncbi:hypothetical protein PENTCL1PPCAC_13141, partial [Pristionchus entomophagus]
LQHENHIMSEIESRPTSEAANIRLDGHLQSLNARSGNRLHITTVTVSFPAGERIRYRGKPPMPLGRVIVRHQLD